MTKRPYIGVTGFMHPTEIEIVQDLFDPAGSHQLMVGLLVSAKSWRGLPTRHASCYPDPARLGELVAAVDPARAFALVHYNAFGPASPPNYASRKEWLDDEDVLFDDCIAILRRLTDGSPDMAERFGGFQYNFPLPNRASLYWLETRREKRCGTPTRSVLQLWPRQLEMVRPFLNDDREWSEVLDYLYASHRQNTNFWPFGTLLCDASGGQGCVLNPTEVIASLEPLIHLTQRKTDLNLAVAGGLSAETVPILKPVIETYPELSIDAQGRLRDDHDRLDLDAVRHYVEAALKLLS